jgi:glycosyltransferase involved in cell wall biosynthesis
MITHNRARFLPEAIESVLNQTFQDWEMIIVDDASTDNTKDSVDAYARKDDGIVYVCNEAHKKISESRNRSLSHAKGKYIAVLDSDDVWLDVDKLKKQVRFLDENPDHVLVGTGVVVIGVEGEEKKRYLNPQNDPEIRNNIYGRNPFAHSSVMYRKDVVNDLGGYDVSLETAEDYDLFLRLGQRGNMVNLAEYMVGYRVHGSNITISDRLQTMVLNIALVKKYRGIYPGYFRAIVRRRVRLVIYRIVKLLRWV